MPLLDCPCGCGWTKHVVVNRYSVAEMDLLHQHEARKTSARRKVFYAVKRRRLRRAYLCERCGRPGRTDAHHADYDRALEVEWLCNPCHHIADQERQAREAETLFALTPRAVSWEARWKISVAGQPVRPVPAACSDPEPAFCIACGAELLDGQETTCGCASYCEGCDQYRADVMDYRISYTDGTCNRVAYCPACFDLAVTNYTGEVLCLVPIAA